MLVKTKLIWRELYSSIWIFLKLNIMLVKTKLLHLYKFQKELKSVISLNF